MATDIPTAPEPSVPRDDGAWTAALRDVLAHPERIRVHYQPIVDLRRGSVRGYEALARFPDAPDVAPRAWFDAAGRLGCAGALEAQVVEAALVCRPLLVRDRFIAVNLSPAALVASEVRRVLRGEPLGSVVVEIVDREDDADPGALREALAELRAAGASIAVDEAAGEALVPERLARLRPELVKVDRTVVRGVDADPNVRESVREVLETAGAIGATVVAEGVECDAEVDALCDLGVPLAQGWALGRPAPAMAELDRDVALRIRRRGLPPRSAATLGSLAVPMPEPVSPAGEPLRLPEGLNLAEAARQAMARPPATRYDPVSCVDETGRPCGVVTIDRLVLALAG